MISLTKGNYNDVLYSGQALLILISIPETPISKIFLEKAIEIDKMVGKSFLVCTIDASVEIEILNALSVTNTPEFISIKEKKIYKRLNRIPTQNDLLNMVK